MTRKEGNREVERFGRLGVHVDHKLAQGDISSVCEVHALTRLDDTVTLTNLSTCGALMAIQQYRIVRFTDASHAMIARMNEIVEAYTEKGFVLTVRQLYYQLVARGLIENSLKSYKSIAALVNNARISGEMDWDAIEDRMRAFERRQRWGSGREILQASVDSFHMDMWENQPCRVFVVIEKDALVGVLSGTCGGLDVPLLAARGYPSGSVLRAFAKEDILPNLHDQRVVVIHLGDHDPSGLDMTRDLRERLELFSEFDSHGIEIELRRIALTMEQIQERKPPPNPAKEKDSRFAEYRRRFGTKSWELDALPPDYLAELVSNEIRTHVDVDAWKARLKHVEGVRSKLADTAKKFKA